jgi:hypothetical protein
VITDEIVAGVVVALFSGLTGAGISEFRGVIDYRRSTLRNLAFSKVRTLDRLLKVRLAFETGEQEIIDAELWHLGPELDRYLSALSGLRDPRSLRREWQTYESLQQIVIRHDLSALDAAIDRLAPKEGESPHKPL